MHGRGTPVPPELNGEARTPSPVPFPIEIARNEPLSNPATQNGRNRFPKQRRLLKHADFERVYKQGRRHFASHVTVFYLRREAEPGMGNLRIGFTVGKALGDAVQRNRMKRRLREAVRLTGFKPGISADVVINPKRSLLTADFRTLQSEVAKAFQIVERSFEKGKH